MNRDAAADAPLMPPLHGVGRRPDWRFMVSHPAHVVALGFGSGLAPVAPGTAGTVWGWLAFALLRPHLDDQAIGIVIMLAMAVGWWAFTVTARALRQADPSSVVWDEIIAIWLVLWLTTPSGFWAQAMAVALFRFFDAVKPGPIAWADQRFKRRAGQPIGWAQGFGILLDDVLAAFATLFVIALWKFL